MAHALDTLAYAKRLRDAGIPQQQAEAHAEAAREFMTAELATKADLLAVKTDVLAALKQEIASVKQDAASAQEGTSLQQDVADLKRAIASFGQRIELEIDNLTLRLTDRLGIMIAAGIAALGVIIKLGL